MKLMEAVLTPCPSGFGNYQWNEAIAVDGDYDTIDEYVDDIREMHTGPYQISVTDEISGRIHDEHGVVVKMIPDREEDFDVYYMIWEA